MERKLRTFEREKSMTSFFDASTGNWHRIFESIRGA